MAQNREEQKKAGKQRYLSPLVVSYNAQQLLELLGPAQGYGGTTTQGGGGGPGTGPLMKF